MRTIGQKMKGGWIRSLMVAKRDGYEKKKRRKRRRNVNGEKEE